MKSEYPITKLCNLMSVNRSGYYKWKARYGHKNIYEQNRDLLTNALHEAHIKHISYGYHRLATIVRNETGWLFSDNLAHKCCKFAGIKAKIRHYRWKSPKHQNKMFQNLVCNHWAVTSPLKLIASDMTVMYHKGKRFEWTYMLDAFNNEIISSHISFRQGDSNPYYKCLEDLIEKTKQQHDPVILHTDQGAVYCSVAFYHAHKNYNIIRSMSRVATPTYNPKIESINGWVKAEMYSEKWHKRYATAQQMIDAFVEYYNNQRPAYALNYKTPHQYKFDMGFS